MKGGYHKFATNKATKKTKAKILRNTGEEVKNTIMLSVYLTLFRLNSTRRIK